MVELKIEVWGDFALFSRPELKTERVSYEVITPSAARNIFQAIFWKPEIQYQITQIDVLRPIRWLTFRRNEIEDVIPASNPTPLYIEEKRQQRSSLLLRDVRYRLSATLTLSKASNKTQDEYQKIFLRRLEKGQCVHQPWLGCRECAAYFAPADESQRAIADSRDLGYMFYDLDYQANPSRPPSTFFRAHLEQGRLRVPAPHSPEVKQ